MKKSTIHEQYNPLHQDKHAITIQDEMNSTLVDASISVAVSQLVESGTSCAFALCYGTLCVHDTCSNDTISLLPTPSLPSLLPPLSSPSPPPSLSCPVQLILLEPLQGSLNDLLLDTWFREENKGAERTLSMFAQVVFGLSIAQTLMGLVHGDLYPSNVLFEEVPPETIIYYVKRSTKTYYAIPSNGKVYKICDFDRASATIQGKQVASVMSKEYKKRMDMDLYMLVKSISNMFPWIEDLHRQRNEHGKRLFDFMMHILEDNDSVPGDNIHYFDMFRIYKPNLNEQQVYYYLID
jgi:hypothetical protein